MAAPARILIVDDEPFNRDVLAQELELLDHEGVRLLGGVGQEILASEAAGRPDGVTCRGGREPSI